LEKKLLYLTTENMYGEAYTGIRKKVWAQIESFENKGINTYILYNHNGLNKCLCYNNKKMKKFVAFTQQEYFDIVFNILVEEKISVLYVRYIMASYELLKFYKRIKENLHIKLIVDFPTYPYDEIFKNIERFTLIDDKKFRNEIKRYADFSVNYGSDNEIYGINSISILNGIDVKKIPIRRISKSEDFRIVCVSSICKWHGFDRIIVGLYEHKKNNKIPKTTFTIVGDGLELNTLKDLALKYDLEKEVNFLGNIEDEKQLKEIFDNADIAIGGIGLHRIGINKGGAIKNQEYCARGIPFVLSVKDFHFPDNVDYIKYISQDDTPVCIEELISFVNTNFNENLQKEMRKYAEDNFDWDYVMCDLIKKIKE